MYFLKSIYEFLAAGKKFLKKFKMAAETTSLATTSLATTSHATMRPHQHRPLVWVQAAPLVSIPKIPSIP